MHIGEMSMPFYIHTPETRFSEPRYSEILDLMNRSLFHILLFIQTRFSEYTQFSEQKGSDNHVH